jgi:O-antigen/teichoic acid export membrane protein
VQVLFGAEVRLSVVVVGLLGVSTVGLMTAMVLQPGLIALGAHKSVTIAWLAGTVVLVALLALPGDPIRAGVAAQLAGAALVVVIMLRALSKALRGGARPAAATAGTGVATTPG